MIDLLLSGGALALAAPPTLLFFRNLFLYRPAPEGNRANNPAVSVLIPARNEEQSIKAAVEAALASTQMTVEVVVLDDHSEDATAALVADLARRDNRVRLLASPPVPPGWCGKQHACHVLARAAQYSLLCFLDADVRLQPGALQRLTAFQEECDADLVSGIPCQETINPLEWMVLPLIHFVLLGFLPLGRMRRSRSPAYAAGCGQLFLARKDAYEQAGGHAAIRSTLHDGIKLPRAFRAAGRKTDLCDATDLATCRMYRTAGELWRGLEKNATEGLAAPAMIVPATVLLVGGQIAPFALLACAASLSPEALVLAATASVLAYSTRLAGVIRFRQSLFGAVLHPLGVGVLVAIQWVALGRRLVGRPAVWKGRAVQPT